MLNIATKELNLHKCKPNCFEKTEAGGAFFIFHQITDELSTKHEPRLRTTYGAMYCLGLRSTELSIYNNFKNENEC